jgi:hypothetical protein
MRCGKFKLSHYPLSVRFDIRRTVPSLELLDPGFYSMPIGPIHQIFTVL